MTFSIFPLMFLRSEGSTSKTEIVILREEMGDCLHFLPVYVRSQITTLKSTHRFMNNAV